ncbi:MAG: LolA family protein, partial [Flavobacteriales bacterium]
MKKILSLTASLFFACTMLAQDAEEVLGELSQKAKSYTSIKASYTSRLIDNISGVDIPSKGTVTTKGEKYRLDTGDYLIISDGETMWTYQKEHNEVSIDYLEDMGDDGIDPSKFFTLWEKDFTSTMKGEINIDGIDCYEIYLYPTEPEEKSFHTIKMFVDKKKMEVYKLDVKGRDGTDVTYKVKTFETDGSVGDSIFKFSESEFPGV